VRAIHFAHDGVIEHGDLGIAADAGSAREALTYKAQKQRLLEAFERHYLQRLMAEHRGNVTRAARASGKERRDLGKRLKRLGIDPRTFAH
jgi:DNA-binding NtrC family response regulator